MKTRTITSVFILLVTIPLIIFSQYIIYPIALAALSFVATYEILRALSVEKEYLLSVPAFILSAALPFGSFFVTAEKSQLYLLTIAALMFFYLIYIMGVAVFSKGRISFKMISEVFMIITYVIVSFSSLSIIRYINRDVGVFWLALVFIVSWVSDSGAYIVGSLIGKHKLIPDVSPKKSVEGSVGGIFLATVCFVLYGIAVEHFTDKDANYIILVVAAILLSVISQIGDLIASLIKREYGIKDYGKILPGHGGIMDRFDSILAVSLPLCMICLWISPFN